MFDYGWQEQKKWEATGGNVGYDLVAGRDPSGYYLVGGAGYEFLGYE